MRNNEPLRLWGLFTSSTVRVCVCACVAFSHGIHSKQKESTLVYLYVQNMHECVCVLLGCSRDRKWTITVYN